MVKDNAPLHRRPHRSPQTAAGGRRTLAQFFHPYPLRWANALSTTIWLLCLLTYAGGLYIAIHDDPGWPWEHQALLATIRTVSLHWSQADEDGSALTSHLLFIVVLALAPYVAWGALRLWSRQPWSAVVWPHIAPVAMLCLAIALFSSTAASPETLYLTRGGLWTRSGPVNWSRIVGYRWDQLRFPVHWTSPDGRTSYHVLTPGDRLSVTLRDALPYPLARAWGIRSDDVPRVATLIRRYVP